MAASNAKLKELEQSQQSQQSVKILRKNTGDNQVYVLLHKIQKRVWVYLNSKSQDSFDEVIGSLDGIKMLLSDASSNKIRDILSEIEMKDKELWKTYQWELVDSWDWDWHENNDLQALKRKWINVDTIMSMGVRAKTNKLVTIILKMSAIYWVTPEILRNPPKPK